MKKPLIPFGWLPGHWGLKGTTREIARAEYELSGADLEIRLAELRSEPEDFPKKRLEILRRHGLMTVEEFDSQMTELGEFDDPKKKALAKLDLDLKYERITRERYDRARADLLGEPWVSMPRIHWNPLGKSRAYFELEYNEHFLSQLRENGYEGGDDDIVNQWMNYTCAGILNEISENNFVSGTRPGGPDPDDE